MADQPYAIDGNSHTVRWLGGGPKSKITVQLFDGMKIVKTLMENKRNRGRFVWKIPAGLPFSSNYRLLVSAQGKNPESIKDVQTLFTGTFTLEPSGNMGHRLRNRLWRRGGGP
mmetsp:Transcript_60185/g.142479  ORF Transcript_60185/g.142479 Transcript_60185/m.142479 type:complete len:113 (-) Transcript_60185:57-395(-)